MLRTVMFVCTLPKTEADALNAESGRIYTDTLVRHYRLYRKQGAWLAPKNGERLEDAPPRADYPPCPQPRCSEAWFLQSVQNGQSL